MRAVGSLKVSPECSDIVGSFPVATALGFSNMPAVEFDARNLEMVFYFLSNKGIELAQ